MPCKLITTIGVHCAAPLTTKVPELARNRERKCPKIIINNPINLF